MKIYISGKLNTMNEFITANRSGYHVGNAMKHKNQNRILHQIRQQLKRPLKPPIFLDVEVFRGSKRIDPDNIATFFTKVFCDALVQGGYIRNDGWNVINGFCFHFYHDEPEMIVVNIEEDI